MCELTKNTFNSTQTGRKEVSSVSMNCWHCLKLPIGRRLLALPNTIRRALFALKFITPLIMWFLKRKDLKQGVKRKVQEFLRRIFPAGNLKGLFARSFLARMTNRNLKVSGKRMHSSSFSKVTLE